MAAATSKLEAIESRIVLVHDRPVLLDADLAHVFGVPRRRLHELVQRHYNQFPGDICFQPERFELPPDYDRQEANAFTEQGVWMLAIHLGTDSAPSRTIDISRAFDRYRRRSARAS